MRSKVIFKLLLFAINSFLKTTTFENILDIKVLRNNRTVSISRLDRSKAYACSVLASKPIAFDVEGNLFMDDRLVSRNVWLSSWVLSLSLLVMHYSM